MFSQDVEAKVARVVSSALGADAKLHVGGDTFTVEKLDTYGRKHALVFQAPSADGFEEELFEQLHAAWSRVLLKLLS